MSANEYVAVILTGAAVIGALTVIWKTWGKVRAGWDEAKAVLVAIKHTLIGRPAIHDSIVPGKIIAEPIKSIGERMESVETGLGHIATLLESQQAQDRRIDESWDKLAAHDLMLLDHAEQLADLKNARMERVAGHIDSAAAWRAVEAVANTDPPEPPAV